ncbi:uncharacterized protein LOC127870222 [Dreissena polymorpha]|uniref:C2H2-type domain-containing protein n=1 Tax=Dreissena polymorpha TaxID=45954 RepID=A0A9D4LW76_DREPO|nr:uncharacterized protein LOC127870222 [Dreissena polymorpha]KAH3864909.1 hypothetical protein DPMN_027942 [Dreissena polymorpha]
MWAMANKVIDGKFGCSICGKQLSRPQRLVTHMESKHPDQQSLLPELAGRKRGMYKQYEIDDAASVPERTKYRKLDGNQSQPTQYESMQCQEDTKCDTEKVHDVAETSKDAPRNEQYMAILAYVNKMKLSGSAAEHLLRLIDVLGNASLEDTTTKELKSSFCDTEPLIYDFCDQCFKLYPMDEEVFRCSTEGCEGMRYTGTEDSQYRKRRKSFFSTVPLQQQLVDILNRDGIMDEMKNPTTVTMTMNTDEIPLYNSSNVSLWLVFLVINEIPPSESFFYTKHDYLGFMARMWQAMLQNIPAAACEGTKHPLDRRNKCE